MSEQQGEQRLSPTAAAVDPARKDAVTNGACGLADSVRRVQSECLNEAWDGAAGAKSGSQTIPRRSSLVKVGHGMCMGNLDNKLLPLLLPHTHHVLSECSLGILLAVMGRGLTLHLLGSLLMAVMGRGCKGIWLYS
uniref:Uncharacterized protein n=1 Tax=Knipowitschia caucasica TaxID=637954 RepID=A0AAV2KRQ7_KNICA